MKTHLKTHNGEKSNNCNQCDYASSQAGNLRSHTKTHNGEKSNTCNQCDFASSQASSLKKTFENTQWKKSNKFNQCGYESLQVSTFRKHLKTDTGEKCIKCSQSNFFIFSIRQLKDIFENTHKRKVEQIKSDHPLIIPHICPFFDTGTISSLKI